MKHFFHGKSDIHHQLLFNIDVSYTLQHIHKQLVEFESENTLNYLQSGYVIPKHGKFSIGQRSYIIGQLKRTKPTIEQSTALGSFGNIEIFLRLLKDGILYHSRSYKKSCGGKRDNIHCRYKNEYGDICLGEIEIFTITPHPSALIHQLQPLRRSLISKAGNPCRSCLTKYQEVDLLNLFIIPVDLGTNTSPLQVVPIDSIIHKVCIVSVHNKCYCVVQPNSIERH